MWIQGEVKHERNMEKYWFALKLSLNYEVHFRGFMPIKIFFKRLNESLQGIHILLAFKFSPYKKKNIFYVSSGTRKKLTKNAISSECMNRRPWPWPLLWFILMRNKKRIKFIQKEWIHRKNHSNSTKNS